MKKFLSLIGAVGLMVPAVSSVVSCFQETEFDKKLKVFNAVQDIVSEGISFNDDFLLNYDLGLNGTKEQIDSFEKLIRDEFNNGVLGIFNKLLAKIIWEKLDQKMPKLKQEFPDFNLVVYFNGGIEDANVYDAIPKIIKGEETKLKYNVGLNFSSYDLVETLNYGNKNRKQDINEELPFRLGLNRQTREFLVDGSKIQKLNYEQPIFTFKQKSIIKNYNQWLDYYQDLYNNFYLGKALVTDKDEFHNFSKYGVFFINSIDKKKLELDSNTSFIKLIVNEAENKFALVDKTKQHIRESINLRPFNNYENYKTLDLIDHYSIDKLEFVQAYTNEQLLANPSLKRSFDLSLSDFDPIVEGMMTFDLTLKFGHEGYEDRVHQERIYLYETTDRRS